MKAVISDYFQAHPLPKLCFLHFLVYSQKICIAYALAIHIQVAGNETRVMQLFSKTNPKFLPLGEVEFLCRSTHSLVPFAITSFWLLTEGMQLYLDNRSPK